MGPGLFDLLCIQQAHLLKMISQKALPPSDRQKALLPFDKENKRGVMETTVFVAIPVIRFSRPFKRGLFSYCFDHFLQFY